MESSAILDVRIGSPPEPFNASEDVRSIPNATWIFYKIRAVDHVDYKRGKWQALILSGLVRDFGKTQGLPPLVGQSLTIVWPDGREEYDAANTILDPAADEPVLTITDSELTRQARDGIRRLNAHLQQTRVSRLLQRPAAEFVIRTSDPAGFMTKRDDNIWAIVGAINGESGRPLGEGAYVEVRDAAGRFVTASGYAARLRQGTGASSPAFETPEAGGLLRSPDQ